MTQESRGAVTTEVWFYHLERASVERVLPDLLQKTVDRGWRALVRSTDPAQLDALDMLLWTYRPDSFLAHGLDTGGDAEKQPILLTSGPGNANHAHVLFLLHGAAADDVAGFKRCVTIFDGADENAVTDARAFWKDAKSREFDVTYWRQSPSGKWEKQA